MELTIKTGDSIKLNGKRIEGYLVRYTNSKEPDLMKDFFTKNTNYGGIKELPIFYDHGQNYFIEREQVGMGEVKYLDDGVFISAELSIKNPEQFKREELERRQSYLSMIEEMAGKGMLGWSSGAVSHLVKYEKASMSDTTEIKQWILGEASLTPTPAEPKNMAAIKKIEDKYFKAGAKISASRLEKFRAAHSAMGEALTMMEEILGEVDGEEKSVTNRDLEERLSNLEEDIKTLLNYAGYTKSKIETVEIIEEPFMEIEYGDETTD